MRFSGVLEKIHAGVTSDAFLMKASNKSVAATFGTERYRASFTGIRPLMNMFDNRSDQFGTGYPTALA